MADPTDKVALNIDGPYYVDAQCIDCDLCRQTAPENFSRDAAGGYSYVCRQPTTPEQVAQCLEALDECPVEAIGRDG